MPKIKTRVWRDCPDPDAIMAGIFGSGIKPPPGDTFVCAKLCAHFDTDRCPFRSKGYRGLCGYFEEVCSDLGPLIEECIEHYPPQVIIAFRVRQ